VSTSLCGNSQLYIDGGSVFLWPDLVFTRRGLSLGRMHLSTRTLINTKTSANISLINWYMISHFQINRLPSTLTTTLSEVPLSAVGTLSG